MILLVICSRYTLSIYCCLLWSPV